jgi:hypothetical protein
MPHFTGHVVFDPVVFVIRARKGRESSAVGTIALTVFPAVSISRFRLPGSVAEGDCQTRSALEGLTLHAAAARHARMRRRRTCNVNLDDLRWDRPDIDCEPQQAWGIRRDLQLDETVGVLFACRLRCSCEGWGLGCMRRPGGAVVDAPLGRASTEPGLGRPEDPWRLVT